MKTRIDLLSLLAALAVFLAALTGCDAAPPDPDPGCAPGVRATTAARAAGEWEFLGLAADTLGSVQDVAVSPFDPDLLLAALFYNFSEGFPGYLFRSDDGGASWEATLVGGGNREVHFSPVEPGVAFALPHGVVKSTDGGRTWFASDEGLDLVPDEWVQTLALDPHDPSGQTLFAGTVGFFPGTLWRSADGGASWAEVPPACEDRSVPACRLKQGVSSLAFDPDRAGVLYAGTTGLGDVLKSEDGGQTWALALDNSGSIVSALVVDAADPAVVYASLEGNETKRVWRSEDGGATWGPYNEGLPEPLNVGEMVQDPAARTLYLLAGYVPSTPATVWRRAGGGSWEAFGPEGELIGRSEALHLSPGGWLYAGGRGLWRRGVRGTTAAEPGPCGR